MILKMVQKEAAFIFIKFQIALGEVKVKIKELIELMCFLLYCYPHPQHLAA